MGRLRLVLVLALLAALVPARAGAVVIATTPGSTTYGYAGVVFVGVAGQPLTYVNADVTTHNVQSDAVRTPEQATAPHCVAYSATTCPLFVSDEIGLGERGEVKGIEDLPTGVYPFHCAPHDWMRAFLVVVNG